MKDIKLNNHLYRVITRDEIDFSLVEELLKEGADPIGSCSEEYEDETVFGEALINAQDTEDYFYNNNYPNRITQLPRLAKLFLDYGMDINKCEWDLLHPLTWLRHEYGAQTLKLLLDAGITPGYADGFVGDMIGDMLQFESYAYKYDPKNNAYWCNRVIWAFKMTMLTASYYKEVLEECKDISHLIEPGNNKGSDLGLFRNWNRYEYDIETPSESREEGDLDGRRLNIIDIDSSEVVWSFIIKGFL